VDLDDARRHQGQAGEPGGHLLAVAQPDRQRGELPGPSAAISARSTAATRPGPSMKFRTPIITIAAGWPKSSVRRAASMIAAGSRASASR